jgi:hypothetical protein
MLQQDHKDEPVIVRLIDGSTLYTRVDLQGRMVQLRAPLSIQIVSTPQGPMPTFKAPVFGMADPINNSLAVDAAQVLFIAPMDGQLSASYIEAVSGIAVPPTQGGSTGGIIMPS